MYEYRDGEVNADVKYGLSVRREGQREIEGDNEDREGILPLK